MSYHLYVLTILFSISVSDLQLYLFFILSEPCLINFAAIFSFQNEILLSDHALIYENVTFINSILLIAFPFPVFENLVKSTKVFGYVWIMRVIFWISFSLNEVILFTEQCLVWIVEKHLGNEEICIHFLSEYVFVDFFFFWYSNEL